MYTEEYVTALNHFNDFFIKVVEDIKKDNRKLKEAHEKAAIPYESYEHLLKPETVNAGIYIVPVERWFELSNTEIKSIESVIRKLYSGRFNRCKIKKMLFKKAYKVDCYLVLSCD